MTVNVSGIETIELTDPKGLCNQHVIPVNPFGSVLPPKQSHPIPVRPPWRPLRDHKDKWGRGIPTPLTAEPTKWEKNWQSSMSRGQMQEAYGYGYTAING